MLQIFDRFESKKWGDKELMQVLVICDKSVVSYRIAIFMCKYNFASLQNV